MLNTDVDWGSQDSQVRTNSHGPINLTLSALMPKSEEWFDLEWTMHDPDFPRTEYLLALRIFREFANGFAALAAVPASVVLWGSARFKPEDPFYRSAVETSRLLASAGFGIITGGGPGIMEAANKGAQEAGGFLLDSPWSPLPVSSPTNSRIFPWCSAISSPAKPCSSNTPRRW